MDARVQVLLTDPVGEMVAAWEEVFADRHRVKIVQSSPVDVPADAWAITARRGVPDGPWDAALPDAVTDALREQLRTRFGGALPTDHAVTVPTGRAHPRFVIAVSSAPTHPEGVDDVLRVAIASAAALQAVHMQNAAEPGSIGTIVLPRLGAPSVPAGRRAELMWTAHALFRQAELPDFQVMRLALTELLADVPRDAPPGAFKRRFDLGARELKSTVPDRSAAQAQRRVKATIPDRAAALAQRRSKQTVQEPAAGRARQRRRTEDDDADG